MVFKFHIEISENGLSIVFNLESETLAWFVDWLICRQWKLASI